MSDVSAIMWHPRAQGAGQVAEGIAMAIRIHYGGQAFSLPDSQADVLRAHDGSAGTLELKLTNGGWLRLAVGPGVPIAVEQVVPGVARVIR